ncbi:MAG: hypothetical protein J3Q66DRAFT_25981 [Benniella sp.]|nr:MAG: hypothetical protein J3Q66DRAFT_25981 [Benniella sp.]
MSSAVRKIIVFQDDTPQDVIDKAAEDVEASGGKITQRYELIPGFAAEFPEASVSAMSSLSALNANPKLNYIEDDGEVRTQAPVV